MCVKKEVDCSIHPLVAHPEIITTSPGALRSLLFFCENTRLAYVDPEHRGVRHAVRTL
jgi:hypothetical protein